MKLIKCVSVVFLSIALHGSLFADQTVENWSKHVPGTAENASVFYGPTQIKDKTMDDLTIYGPASISNTTINKMATVKGPLEVTKSTFSNIHIEGIAKFDDVKVTKELFINGPLYATNSTLEEVSIASSELKLSNTKVNKILVRKDALRINQQVVYLDKGTKIDSLTFEAKNGRVVFLDSTVSITNLEGGKIEKKE